MMMGLDKVAIAHDPPRKTLAHPARPPHLGVIGTRILDEFCALAATSGKTLNQLAAEIDAKRGDVGLASAIRVHVLAAVKTLAAKPFQT